MIIGKIRADREAVIELEVVGLAERVKGVLMTHFYKHIEEIPKQINPTGLNSYPYMRVREKTLR